MQHCCATTTAAARQQLPCRFLSQPHPACLLFLHPHTLLEYAPAVHPKDTWAPAFSPDPAAAHAIAVELVYKLPTQADARLQAHKGLQQPHPSGTHASRCRSSLPSTHTTKRTAAHRCCAGVVTRAQLTACGQPANAAAVHANKYGSISFASPQSA